MHSNLRSFLDLLKKEKLIVEVKAEVDPYLEIAEIHRRVIENEGPALLFTKVKGSKFPVVTNMFGTLKRVEMAVGKEPEKFIQKAVESWERLINFKPQVLWQERNIFFRFLKIGLKKILPQKAPVLEEKMEPVDLTELPTLTSWPYDGGPFITFPLVYTENPLTREHNIGMYRIQIYGSEQTGIHWQIQKGGGFHYSLAESMGKELPVTLYVGGPPALILAAIAPLPDMVPEMLFASFLMGKKMRITNVNGLVHPLVAEAEFAIIGNVPPHIRKPEGPFGDHYGYYSLVHEFPVFNVKSVFHRRNPIYPATVVGKPRQEDYYIGEYLQSLLAPFFPKVIPGITDLWTYAETGFHSLTAAVVRESYYREALVHAFRILGEGQLSLTKFLILTNVKVNLRNFAAFFTEVLKRFRPETDLFIINETSMDTLDYTGRKFNRGSKAVLLGLGDPVRELSDEYTGHELPGVEEIKVYCPGCLLISGWKYEDNENFAQELLVFLKGEYWEKWPIIIIVDSVKEIKDQTSFLWQVFTRFAPAQDIYANKEIVENRIVFHSPIIIDARMKPFYPAEVTPDVKTVELVNNRWHEYGIKI